MNLDKIYEFVLSQSNDPNDPKTLLKEILHLYNYIYSKAGSVAVKYGNGTHPKHRLTRYHDFFVENVEYHESVIDLGSGRGDVTYDIAKKTSNDVLGIEMNHNNVAYAKNTYSLSNLRFILGNIYSDIPDQHYDVVVLSNVLEHLKNRSELIKRIVNTTTPKKVLIRVPYFERDWTVAMKKELGVPYFLDDDHKIEYTHEEFYGEMIQSELDVISATFKWGEIWAVCKPQKK